MAYPYTHTTRATGTILTSAIYNGDHQNHIDNNIPSAFNDYSATATEMQTNTNPGEVGTESLATTLAGELERLRFILKEIVGGAQWYASGFQRIVDANLNELISFTAVASAINQVDITNASGSGPPIIGVAGTTADVGLVLKTKGTGTSSKIAIQNASASEQFAIQTDAPTSGKTTMYVRYHNGTSEFEGNVTVGSVDSGGTGFRLLRVVN